MYREYHAWHSPSLGRHMEMLVVGHAGAKLLVFPTSRGRFYQWEDRGMFGPHCLQEHIERGWVQAFCVDSVDGESWYNWRAHPSARGHRHSQYMNYITREVLPLADFMNPNSFLIATGASFGAFHAASFAFRFPQLVGRAICMSGLYDIRRFTGDYTDETIYFNNPLEFLRFEHDPHRLAHMRGMDIVIAIGEEDSSRSQSEELSGVLWDKGIGNALRVWGGWSHDWPDWHHMLKSYIGGHD